MGAPLARAHTLLAVGGMARTKMGFYPISVYVLGVALLGVIAMGEGINPDAVLQEDLITHIVSEAEMQVPVAGSSLSQPPAVPLTPAQQRRAELQGKALGREIGKAIGKKLGKKLGTNVKAITVPRATAKAKANKQRPRKATKENQAALIKRRLKQAKSRCEHKQCHHTPEQSEQAIYEAHRRKRMILDKGAAKEKAWKHAQIVQHHKRAAKAKASSESKTGGRKVTLSVVVSSISDATFRGSLKLQTAFRAAMHKVTGIHTKNIAITRVGGVKLPYTKTANQLLGDAMHHSQSNSWDGIGRQIGDEVGARMVQHDEAFPIALQSPKWQRFEASAETKEKHVKRRARAGNTGEGHEWDKLANQLAAQAVAMETHSNAAEFENLMDIGQGRGRTTSIRDAEALIQRPPKSLVEGLLEEGLGNTPSSAAAKAKPAKKATAAKKTLAAKKKPAAATKKAAKKLSAKKKPAAAKAKPAKKATAAKKARAATKEAAKKLSAKKKPAHKKATETKAKAAPTKGVLTHAEAERAARIGAQLGRQLGQKYGEEQAAKLGGSAVRAVRFHNHKLVHHKLGEKNELCQVSFQVSCSSAGEAEIIVQVLHAVMRDPSKTGLDHAFNAA